MYHHMYNVPTRYESVFCGFVFSPFWDPFNFSVSQMPSSDWLIGLGAIMCLFSWRVYVLVMVMLLLFDRLVKWSVAWLSYDRVFLTVTSCLVSCVYLIYLSFTELIVLKPNKNVNNRQWTTKKKLLTIDVGPEVVFSSVLCMWMTRFSITTSFSYQVLSCIRPTKH